MHIFLFSSNKTICEKEKKKTYSPPFLTHTMYRLHYQATWVKNITNKHYKEGSENEFHLQIR